MNGSAYIMVVMGILIAKGLGFLRDIVFASVFGATAYTDMYFQIFGLVNLIFTGIGVALQTLVIKNLNKPGHESHEKQREYVSSFISKTTVTTAVVTILLYALSSPIVKLLLPGLSPSLHHVAMKMMYIMLPSFLFVIIAYIISGVLQNNRVFFISSIMSLPFNVIIILSLFVKDIDVVTVGIVTTIGWFLHIAIQLPAFYKKGFRLFSGKISFKLSQKPSPEVIYIFISNMMFQLCFMIDKAFVSETSGAATTINYASNLFVTIASVFVVAMSNVCYPSISKNYEEGNHEYVRELVKYIITLMFAIFTPFVLTVCCFGKNIIGLLYERGEFTQALTIQTAMLFAIYTLGILGYVCQELFNKILYLGNKYSYTVIGTIVVVALKPLLNKIFAPWGAVAVATSTAVLFTLYALVVFFAMTKVTGNYFKRDLLKEVSKILLAGFFAFMVYFISKLVLPGFTEGKFTFIAILLLCGVVYIGMLFLTGTVKKIIKRS